MICTICKAREVPADATFLPWCDECLTKQRIEQEEKKRREAERALEELKKPMA